MTNPNDNSELFEIFQNQVDLGQDQDDEDDQEEEPEENEQEEAPEQEDQPEQAPETNTTSEESSQPKQDTSNTTQPESERPSSPNQQSNRTEDPPSSQDPPPSSTVTQEEGTDPDTETGSYIQDMEEEKELEGKIILSRGASVFLLILAIIAMIGAYFIGLQTGSNQQIVDSKTAVTPEATQEGQNVSENQTGNVQNATGSSNENQSERETADNGNDNYGIVPGRTYYTIGLIAYKSSQNNVQNYVSAIQRSLREDAKLRYVSSVQNPVGNRQIWVVVGYFKDRDTAKQKLAEIEDNLNQTDYRNDFNKDILEISSEEARKIAGS
jgi:hypothetical protein